MQPTENA